MIINHGRQPRPRRPARLVEDEKVKHRVIGLPDRVGHACPVPVDHLKPVAEGGCAFEGQCHDGRIDRGKDRVNRAVRGHSPALCHRDLGNAAVNRSGGTAWLFQRHAFDEGNQLDGRPADSGVTANCAGQTGKPTV